MYVKRDEIMSKNGAENLVNMMWKVEKLFREQQYTSDYKNEFWSNPQNTPTFNKVFKLLGISHKNEWLRGVHNLFRRINKYNYIQIQVTLDERVTYDEIVGRVYHAYHEKLRQRRNDGGLEFPIFDKLEKREMARSLQALHLLVKIVDAFDNIERKLYKGLGDPHMGLTYNWD